MYLELDPGSTAEIEDLLFVDWQSAEELGRRGCAPLGPTLLAVWGPPPGIAARQPADAEQELIERASALGARWAVADGHPEPELLRTLAGVLSGDTPAEQLDAHESWRSA